MFEDITTKDITLDEEHKIAAYSLLCKYLVLNIDNINEGTIKQYIGYWFDDLKKGGVNTDQIKEFRKELRSYIPETLC